MAGRLSVIKLEFADFDLSMPEIAPIGRYGHRNYCKACNYAQIYCIPILCA